MTRSTYSMWCLQIQTSKSKPPSKMFPLGFRWGGSRVPAPAPVSSAGPENHRREEICLFIYLWKESPVWALCYKSHKAVTLSKWECLQDRRVYTLRFLTPHFCWFKKFLIKMFKGTAYNFLHPLLPKRWTAIKRHSQPCTYSVHDLPFKERPGKIKTHPWKYETGAFNSTVNCEAQDFWVISEIIQLLQIQGPF